MIEQIKGYFVLTACFFLLFLLATFLADRYRIQIQLFCTKLSRLSKKIPWNTITKILSVWVFILFSRKLTYYLPISGVIRTKDTIWCGNGYMVFVIFLFFWLSGVLIQAFNPIFRSKSKSRGKFDKHMLIFVGFGLITFFSLYAVAKISLGHFLIVFFSVPLVVLKMVCQGKYLGLLTSLILVFFTIYGYKKRKKISLRFKEFSIFFLFVGVILLGVYKFTGNCEQRFITKVEAAKTQSAFEELLEAAQSITGDVHQSNALKHIAVAIAKTGDTRWAAAVASGIADEEIKNKALEEIRKK